MKNQRDENYLKAAISHFDKLIENGLAVYGADPCAMWMASLDTKTGQYPEDDRRPPHIPKRAYRYIDAPRGSNLYWDQPAIAAAHAVSQITGMKRYADAADAYVRDFLDRCVAPNGMFLWGNHYYYDAFRDAPVWFGETPVPCLLTKESGKLHEMRPIVPAWDSFWRISPEKTERAIRAAVDGHLVDPDTGRFNRHADNEEGCAFLEAGGILVDTLSWLHQKTGDAELVGTAGKIALYSFQNRNESTGLLENNPTVTRWDKHTSTTEVGLWAGCLLRAASRCHVAEWAEMADAAVSAWLRLGYDETAERFYGRLDVGTGAPILGPKETTYQPGDHSDLWDPLFPAHDYPMPFAESCLALYRITGKDIYQTACRRWINQIRNSLPARHGKGGYAEHYGRCLNFLLGYAKIMDDSAAHDLAINVADEAMNVLYSHGMFRGHAGEDRYDALDGVGFLLLALMRLQTGSEPETMGLAW